MALHSLSSYVVISEICNCRSSSNIETEVYIDLLCAMSSVTLRSVNDYLFNQFVQNFGSTTDIDVVFSKNADLIHECALEISEEMGVDRSWCNDMVMLSSSYTPEILTYNSLYKTYGCLDVYTLHEELIFCMKLIAFREKDADDIDYLIDYIESKGEKITMADINSWFDKYYESFGRKPKFKKTAVQFIKETFR